MADDRRGFAFTGFVPARADRLSCLTGSGDPVLDRGAAHLRLQHARVIGLGTGRLGAIRLGTGPIGGCRFRVGITSIGCWRLGFGGVLSLGIAGTGRPGIVLIGAGGQDLGARFLTGIAGVMGRSLRFGFGVDLRDDLAAVAVLMIRTRGSLTAVTILAGVLAAVAVLMIRTRGSLAAV